MLLSYMLQLRLRFPAHLRYSSLASSSLRPLATCPSSSSCPVSIGPCDGEGERDRGGGASTGGDLDSGSSRGPFAGGDLANSSGDRERECVRRNRLRDRDRESAPRRCGLREARGGGEREASRRGGLRESRRGGLRDVDRDGVRLSGERERVGERGALRRAGVRRGGERLHIAKVVGLRRTNVRLQVSMHLR